MILQKEPFNTPDYSEELEKVETILLKNIDDKLQSLDSNVKHEIQKLI
jgi:hypothetical protein